MEGLSWECSWKVACTRGLPLPSYQRQWCYSHIKANELWQPPNNADCLLWEIRNQKTVHYPFIPKRRCPILLHVCSSWPVLVIKSDSMVGWLGCRQTCASLTCSNERLANFFIQCDTLIKYLVDSLQSFESGHGDALHPIPIDPTNFFMGNHTATAPATTEEVHQLSASISWNIQALATTVESAFSKTTNRQDISQPMIGEVQTVGGTNMAGLGYEHPGSNQLAFQVGLPQSNEGWDSQMTTVSHQPNMSDSTSQHSRLRSHRKSASAPPIADVSIPSLSCGPGAWRQALKQWIEVDPHTGFALKDWPTKWYTGLMKDKTASLRSQRQVIFEEYEQ